MDLLTTTLAEAAEAIKSRELSPVELTQATLDRIDLLEPRLNAFITLCGERAMEAARVAEQEIARGRYRGPNAWHSLRREGHLLHRRPSHHQRLKGLPGPDPERHQHRRAQP